MTKSRDLQFFRSPRFWQLPPLLVEATSSSVTVASGMHTPLRTLSSELLASELPRNHGDGSTLAVWVAEASRMLGV
jgi:hypothetical protein